MYKPGTQLIINELWAAATARKLGFELDSGRIHWDKKTEFWNTGFSVSADKWRITVTESGPNAVKKFLPQVDDVLRGLSMPDKYAGMISKDFMSEWLRAFSAVKIIERDGIPFPKFSEVIKP
jgi:hypothetical protein